MMTLLLFIIFFFNDTATTEIYTLSLHDALPIYIETDAGNAASHSASISARVGMSVYSVIAAPRLHSLVRCSKRTEDRKSTRLNSSHANISYAVFCLKKKKHKLKYVYRRKTLKTK